MRHEVRLTADAERDLEGIYTFIADADSVKAADRILDRVSTAVETLATLPERGSRLRELEALGFHVYRQIMLKPWRMIYRIIGTRVFVYMIADGRRDMRSLLAQRLLGS
jgi:toxin ParE1/3/4